MHNGWDDTLEKLIHGYIIFGFYINVKCFGCPLMAILSSSGKKNEKETPQDGRPGNVLYFRLYIFTEKERQAVVPQQFSRFQSVKQGERKCAKRPFKLVNAYIHFCLLWLSLIIFYFAPCVTHFKI